MAIITISRGTYSKGKEIAEKVAKKLDFECISRDILLEASKEFHVPEVKLVRAIHDGPGILSRLGHKKEQYTAYFQSAILKRMINGKVVYHGLAGHFFVKDVPHVLKVRIIANMDDRVKWEMEREGLDEKEARKLLIKDDEQRRKWSYHLYGIDTNDPSLYDLVIHIDKITVDDAVEIICNAVKLDDFQKTEGSAKALRDLALAAELKALLINELPGDFVVNADDGDVTIRTEGPMAKELELVKIIKETVGTYSGVKDVHVNVVPVLE